MRSRADGEEHRRAERLELERAAGLAREAETDPAGRGRQEGPDADDHDGGEGDEARPRGPRPAPPANVEVREGNEDEREDLRRRAGAEHPEAEPFSPRQ